MNKNNTVKQQYWSIVLVVQLSISFTIIIAAITTAVAVGKPTRATTAQKESHTTLMH